MYQLICFLLPFQATWQKGKGHGKNLGSPISNVVTWDLFVRPYINIIVNDSLYIYAKLYVSTSVS